MSASMSSGTQPISKTSADSRNPADRQRARREEAQRRKGLQEEALRNLPHQKLYVVLWIRKDPPVANDFHWGLYYHQNQRGGMKYHQTNVGSGWMGDHAHTGGVFKSAFLCVLVQIGSVPAGDFGRLDEIMRSYDGSSNSILGFTCRVWIFMILKLLVEAGLLRCKDLPSLQEECFTYGNTYMVSAGDNDQPRPVRISSLCS